MIIVDKALKARADAKNPVRVGLIGAGFMGRGIANQIINSVPGMRLVAVANRTLASAWRCYTEASVPVTDVAEVETASQFSAAVARGSYVVTGDPTLVCRSEGIEVIIEVTGSVEYGARVTLDAINHGKHVILMNAEVDGTVGPILKAKAQTAGVIVSGSDGDQPGVQMNLYRFVKSIGLTPLLCGNIKGLQDPYRTPSTQKAFAERWGQNPHMVTSFADGTKISFEQAVVANATGMCVARRGMLGYNHDGHVDELTARYDVEELRELGGIVDYVVGAKPGPGVFVLAAHDDPKQRHYLNLYKLGEGPLYSFYTPYHLCHFEAPLSAARVAIFGDAVLQPLGGPRVEVISIAKRDLKAGEILDKLGGYMTYGQAENASITAASNFLPIGVAEGCRLRHDLPKDTPLTYSDVELPTGRLVDLLRIEQAKKFSLGYPSELEFEQPPHERADALPRESRTYRTETRT
ncbi:NAD(P)H-dependent oxidoreductase [Microvirga pakistanensis]|uniref:NAD(P)H-dependent oxidoreductase n=1 Tax=Microvirga pakistanensis TaxID=1682650 RepID=UPI00106D8B4F|nr:SAF domain-containing protein [Microvirga pakistanensis]